MQLRRSEHGGKGFGYFKPLLADLLIAHLTPIREEMSRLMNDPYELDAVLVEGGHHATVIAQETCREARDALGFWSPLDRLY